MKRFFSLILLLGAALVSSCGSDSNTSPMPVAKVPHAIQTLFTAEQAADISSQLQQIRPDTVALTDFNKIKKTYAGFYPEVNFCYDGENDIPNIYAYEADGRKVVRVSGGLARLEGLSYEGLFMAMAYGVGCFYGELKNRDGFAAIGAADYYAFSQILREIVPPGSYYSAFALSSVEQWGNLFSKVSPGNAAGNPDDPLENPSLSCRLAAINSALMGNALPECAVAPPSP